jgi:hypothetical protein
MKWFRRQTCAEILAQSQLQSVRFVLVDNKIVTALCWIAVIRGFWEAWMIANKTTSNLKFVSVELMH